MKQTKHLFVTGGVVSSLGKGITAASIALLLIRRGYTVRMQKLDPYLNVDPGTMSPYQHGEVYVTEAGTETEQVIFELRTVGHRAAGESAERSDWLDVVAKVLREIAAESGQLHRVAQCDHAADLRRLVHVVEIANAAVDFGQ